MAEQLETLANIETSLVVGPDAGTSLAGTLASIGALTNVGTSLVGAIGFSFLLVEYQGMPKLD